MSSPAGQKEGSKTISIPEKLFRKIEERVKNSEFDSVEDYVVYVLNEVVSDGGEDFSGEDDEKIKKRLKDLGYLE